MTMVSPRAATALAAIDVCAQLHAHDPYAGFDAGRFELDLQGWNGDHAVFGALIDRLQPNLVVEVGTWKGQSAITIARHLERQGRGAKLVCVDTWLGALEFWTDQKNMRYRGLDLRHGYPQVYYQFLANVVLSDLQRVIVPFPQSSTTAARWFLHNGISADLIYVDASHEENDVYMDLVCYWHVLRPGGVMFGDDYTGNWPGVVHDVDAFCDEFGVRAEIVDDHFWVVEKPAIE